jgi:hypothetical protein
LGQKEKHKIMKIQIDLKSAVLGLIVGAVAIFTLGDATSQPNQNGRYQCAVALDGSGNNGVELILNTQTGKAWNAINRATIAHDDGDSFWNAKSITINLP